MNETLKVDSDGANPLRVTSSSAVLHIEAPKHYKCDIHGYQGEKMMTIFNGEKKTVHCMQCFQDHISVTIGVMTEVAKTEVQS